MMQAIIGMCVLASSAAAQNYNFRISNVFGSHMVLQRERPVPIWGWSTPGSSVSVTMTGGAKVSATAAAGTGLWKVSLPAQQATKVPVTITASSSAANVSPVTLDDVLFGDVLFCSGQSNMEFTVNSAFNSSEEIQAANDFPSIRVTSGPEQVVDTLNGPGFNVSHDELLYTRLPWSVASNGTIGCVGPDRHCSGWDYFSAVCWFAARDLYNEIGGSVPIGAIAQSYGGTSIQYWMSPDNIKATDAPVATQCCGQNGPASCLWNTQVYPYTLGPMQFSATLWYQGEQNANCGGPTQTYNGVYSTMLQTMVQDWRSKFNNPTMVFGTVLLAAWDSTTFRSTKDWTSFALMRLAQANLTKYVSNTYTISAIDYGDPDTGHVHSPYKQTVGVRAMRGVAALANKIATSYLEPTYKSSQPMSNGSVYLQFDSDGIYGGLVINNSVTCPPKIPANNCEAFAILSAPDCVWHPAVASYGRDSNEVLLTPANWTTGIMAVASRGYFANWPIVTLKNAVGTPPTPWMSYVDSSSSSCPLVNVSQP